MARRTSDLVDTVLNASGPPPTVRDQTPPTLAGRYQLLALIGSGGAGSVYQVRDLELDEIVALKMLRRKATEARGIEALRREVKLARRVTHKNVARTFDIGESEGERFLTMEFVDGISLGHVICAAPVAVTQAVHIARSIAEGLSAAHEAAVIHRDLKPANVLVESSGRVVITDFGIARLDADPDSSTTWAGTPLYMAPEQLEGVIDLDARVDLYALGEILFELLTGRRTWLGENTFGVASARLTQEPPDPSILRPELPRGLRDVVVRLLARHREDRFASAREVIDGLASRGPQPSGAGASTPATWQDVAPRGSRQLAVAVLPFRNDSEADDYVSDGFIEDLVDTLSTTQALRVRPASVVRRFKGWAGDPRDAGSQLGVDVVVDGTLRRLGADTFQLTLRMLNVPDGFQFWAKTYGVSPGDMFAVRDDAARAIGEALAAHVVAPTRSAASDPAAIDLYLRARQQLGREAYGGDADEAILLLEDALSREPDEPNILAAYAIAHSRMSHTADSVALALRAAERATETAPHVADGWLALASVRQMQAEFPAMVRACAQALRCSPHLAKAHHLLGDVMYQVGWTAGAVRRSMLALALDPSLRGPAITLALAHGLLGQWDRAEAMLSDPSVAGVPVSYIAVGTRSRLALWRRSPLPPAEPPPGDGPAVSFARFFQEVAASQRVSDEAVQNVRRFRSLTSPFIASFVGQIEAEAWALVGRTDRVLEAIEFSNSRGLIDLLWMDRLPLFSQTRGLPDFERLRARVEERATTLCRTLVAEGFSDK